MLNSQNDAMTCRLLPATGTLCCWTGTGGLKRPARFCGAFSSPTKTSKIRGVMRQHFR